MARKLSPIAAEVTLNLNKWTAGIKQVDRDSRAIANSLRPITDIGRQVGSAFAAAGALVGGALLGLSKKAADFGDALLDASKRTGLTTQNLSALKLLADQSGSSFEGLSKGVGQLSKNLFEAGTKGGQSAKLFEAMGISVKDANGHLRNASEVLPEIADRFAKLEDGSTKTALAMKLFGKAGADLIPLLNEGSDGFRRAQQQAEKFGIALTKAEAQLGDKFNDALEDSKAAMQGFANAIGIALLPKLTELVNKANDWIAAASRWTKAHPELTQAIGKTAAILFGAGGLILGLTAILSIVPSVYNGVMLMSKGFQLLSISMTGVGAASIAAKAGMVGLAAGVGFAIGSLANYVIELAGVQKQADEIIAAIARITTFGLLGNNSGIAGGDTKSAGMANAALEAEAKRRGLTVDQLRADSARIGMASHSINAAKKPAAASDLEAQLLKLMGAQEKVGRTASEAATQIDEMWEALNKESTEAASLEVVLTKAFNSHVSLDTIADRLGGTISDVADEFVRSKKPLPEIIAFYNSLIKQSKELADDLEDQEAAMVAANKAIAASVGFWKAERAELNANLRITEEVAITRGDDTQKIIDNAVALGKHTQEIKRGSDAYEVALRKMEQVEAFRRSWGEAFGAISDRLVDMIVDFDFSFRRLGNIAKDTAKSLARSFLDGFFKPFKDGLANLGEGLATKLSGVLFGGPKGGGAQAGLGGLLGGIFSNQPGGSGGLLGGILGGGGAGAMGGGILGAGSLLSGVGSLAGFISPIAGQLNKIGSGRDSANEIVKSQNAFVNQTIGGIINDSGLSATNKLKQVNNAWEAMQANLARFSSAGGEGGVTANQAFATLSPFIARVQSDLIKAGASDGSDAHNGDIILNFNLPAGVDSPEKWIEWFKANKAGIREEVTRGVLLTQGAVVSR